MIGPVDILKGENVRLTAINEQDISMMARWYEDTAYLRLFDARPAMPRTADMIRGDITGLQKSANDFVFAIKPLADETCLGYLEIDGVLWAHGVAGMGIGIGRPEHRGQGLGTEAAQLFVAPFYDLGPSSPARGAGAGGEDCGWRSYVAS